MNAYDILDTIKRIQQDVDDGLYISHSVKRKCGGSLQEHQEIRNCDHVAIVGLGKKVRCDMDHAHTVHDGNLCLLHEYERKSGRDRSAPLLDIMQGTRDIRKPYSPEDENEAVQSLFAETQIPGADWIGERPADADEDEALPGDAVHFFNAAPSSEGDRAQMIPEGGTVAYSMDMKKPGYCVCDWRIEGNTINGEYHDARHRSWDENRKLQEARQALVNAGQGDDLQPIAAEVVTAEDDEKLDHDTFDAALTAPEDTAEAVTLETVTLTPEEIAEYEAASEKAKADDTHRTRGRKPKADSAQAAPVASLADRRAAKEQVAKDLNVVPKRTRRTAAQIQADRLAAVERMAAEAPAPKKRGRPSKAR